jgi:hypothetical protein
MDTHNPITEELKKNSFHNSFFGAEKQNEKATQITESDLSFDLNSVDLNDLDLEHSSASSQTKDEEEAISCCLGFWNWLCPKR